MTARTVSAEVRSAFEVENCLCHDRPRRVPRTEKENVITSLHRILRLRQVAPLQTRREAVRFKSQPSRVPLVSRFSVTWNFMVRQPKRDLCAACRPATLGPNRFHSTHESTHEFAIRFPGKHLDIQPLAA